MKHLIICLCLIYSTGIIAQPVETIEHRVWDKHPIHIVLPVGQERRIDFPLAINLQVPELVRGLSERIQITEAGSVYWIAKQPFKRQRVNAITDTGYSYILDIEAKPKGHRHPIVIVDDRIPKSDGDSLSLTNANYEYDYVDLMRLAAQSIYSPNRLVKELPGVRRISVDAEALPLVRGGDLIIEPIAQWYAPTIPTLYVTALRVQSNSLDAVILDPRDLRGDLLAASSQHGYVNPVGQEGDTTAWYVVTDQPFDEVTP